MKNILRHIVVIIVLCAFAYIMAEVILGYAVVVGGLTFAIILASAQSAVKK